MTLCDHHFGLKNWLYIIFGYMLQNYNEQEVNNCLDQLVSMYLEARSNRFSINDIRIIRDERDQFILSTFEQYLLDVPVRNDLLYNDNGNNEDVNYIILSNIKHHKRSNKMLPLPIKITIQQIELIYQNYPKLKINHYWSNL